MPRIRHLLKEKNFLYLYIGQLISQFGDKLNQMALIAILHSRFPNSSLELAKLLSFTIIPVFLVGPFAGVYVDRHDRRKIMITADILRAILVLLIPFFARYTKSFFPIYIVVLLVFSITRFFIPSKLAIIPDIISSDKLLLANSLFSTTAMIAAVIGLSISGALIAAVGPYVGFVIDSITYIISAAFILKIRPSVIKIPAYRQTRTSNITLKNIYEGLRYCIVDKKAIFVTRTFFVLMGAAGVLYAVMIVFVQESLHTVTKDLGFLASFLGAGLFFGTIIYGKFGSRVAKEKAITLSITTGGALLLVFASELRFVGSFFISVFLTILLGMAISPVAASIQTMIYEAMPDIVRGRIFSSIEIIAHIAFLVFMFIGAALSEHIGRIFIIAAVGIFLIAEGLYQHLQSRRGCGGKSSPTLSG